MGYREQVAAVHARYRSLETNPAPGNEPGPGPELPGPLASNPVQPSRPTNRIQQDTLRQGPFPPSSLEVPCDEDGEEEVLVAEEDMSVSSEDLPRSPSRDKDPASFVGRALRTFWPEEPGRWQVCRVWIC